MSEWTRPLPTIADETRAFWDGCRRGQFIVQRCRSCHQFQTYYRQFCCHCWATDLEDVVTSGEGTVWGSTVTYKNSTPGWEDYVPYCMALIEIDGCDGAKVVTNVINCDPETVDVGTRVRVTFVKAAQDITLPYFEPIDARLRVE